MTQATLSPGYFVVRVTDDSAIPVAFPDTVILVRNTDGKIQKPTDVHVIFLGTELFVGYLRFEAENEIYHLTFVNDDYRSLPIKREEFSVLGTLYESPTHVIPTYSSPINALPVQTFAHSLE